MKWNDVRPNIPKIKSVNLGDFLTDDQITRCIELYPDAHRICSEVIEPNMAEIDRKLGQKNDPMYLSYATCHVINMSSS
jgi:hypothetical protein